MLYRGYIKPLSAFGPLGENSETGEYTGRTGPQPFVRITLYSQEELELYHLDQSDLQHPGDFAEGPCGSQTVEAETLREDSNNTEIGTCSLLVASM